MAFESNRPLEEAPPPHREHRFEFTRPDYRFRVIDLPGQPVFDTYAQAKAAVDAAKGDQG